MFSLQWLDGTTLNAEKKVFNQLYKVQKKFCLSFSYNGESSYLFVNGTKIIKFKANGSEIVATLLYLGNISKDFTADNTKNMGLYLYDNDFSIDYYCRF